MSVNSVFAATWQNVNQQPYINNPYYRQNSYYQTEVLPRDLSALEKYSMNKVYSRENPIHRLERLENLAFGAIQYGDVKSRYKNVENAILSRPKMSSRKTALGTLANYFAGQATGITPSIFDGYNNIMPSYNTYSQMNPSGFGNMRINQYSNGIFGGGYSIFNNNHGNGSSVHILE